MSFKKEGKTMIKMKMTKASKLKVCFKKIVKQAILQSAIDEGKFKFPLGEHIKLWDWLADNPSKDKYDYFDDINLGRNLRPKNLCFGCEFSSKVIKYIEEKCGTRVIDFINSDVLYEGCFACPFDCNAGDNGCLDGVYDEWDEASEYMWDDDHEYDFRTSRAEEIKCFPIRTDVEITLI